MNEYEVDLEYLCKTVDFTPEQVTSASLVFPRGAVPNRQLLWIKVEVEGRDESLYMTRALDQFYDYIRLPKSNLTPKKPIRL